METPRVSSASERLRLPRFSSIRSSLESIISLRDSIENPDELYYRSRVCTRKLCGFTWGTLPQITALGGLGIALAAFLTYMLGFQSLPIFALKAAVGLLIAFTALSESVDGTKLSSYLLDALFTFVIGFYIPVTLAMDPPTGFLCPQTLWALSHLCYVAVMFYIRKARAEAKQYSNYWLLRKGKTSFTAEEIMKDMLSRADLDRLRDINPYQFENLVLTGGGAKGVSILAAVSVLEEAGILQNIDRFCGTSVGSILTCMLAAGMTVDEAIQIAIDLDLDDVVPSSYLNIFGFCFYCIPCRVWYRKAIPGATHKLTLRYRYLLQRIGCHENITLSEFQAQFGRELAICVTDNTHLTTTFLTAKSHPDMPVVLALRASSAIPGVFLPIEWKGIVYTDGGVAANYPIWAYDGNNNPSLANKYSGVMNPRTIGVNLGLEITERQIPSNKQIRFRHKTGAGWAKVRQMFDQQLLKRDKITRVKKQTRYSVTIKKAFRRISVARKTLSVLPLAQTRLLEGRVSVCPPARRSSPIKAIPAPPTCVTESANNPSVAEIFGPLGLAKFIASTMEYMWRSQDRPQDSSRTIMLENCPIGTLEFSVTQNKAKMLQACQKAVRDALDFLDQNAKSRRLSYLSQ